MDWQRCNESSFWKANIVREVPDPYLELNHKYKTKRVIIHLGSRVLKIRHRETADPVWNNCDEYIIKEVINVYWTEYRIIIELSSGSKVYMENYGNGSIQMVNA